MSNNKRKLITVYDKNGNAQQIWEHLRDSFVGKGYEEQTLASDPTNEQTEGELTKPLDKDGAVKKIKKEGRKDGK